MEKREYFYLERIEKNKYDKISLLLKTIIEDVEIEIVLGQKIALSYPSLNESHIITFCKKDGFWEQDFMLKKYSPIQHISISRVMVHKEELIIGIRHGDAFSFKADIYISLKNNLTP